MLILFLILTCMAVIGYLLFSKIIDKETKKNFSFLLKILSIIIGILLVLAILITINH